MSKVCGEVKIKVGCDIFSRIFLVATGVSGQVMNDVGLSGL
jgi:hypothetical protein